MSDYDRILATVSANYAESVHDWILEEMRRRQEMWDRMHPEWAAERKRLQAIGPVHGPERPHMIVSEFIEELRKLPQDAEVWTSDSEWGKEPLSWEGEWLDEEGRVVI